MGPKDIYLARPCVARVERDVAHVGEVVGQETAPAPDAEDASGLAARHVLDSHGDALLARLAQGVRLPALQGPAWRRRMGHYDRDLLLPGQPRDPHQRLFRPQTPGTAAQRRVEGQDRDAVPL